MKISYLYISLCLIFSTILVAQNEINNYDSDKTITPVNNKLFDVTDLLLLFKKDKNKINDTLVNYKKFNYAFVPAVGYTLQTGLAIIASANVGFYNSNAPDAKISSVLTSVAYTQYSQIIFPFQVNYWNKNENYNVIINWRYLNYPSITYGLGGNSSIENASSIDFSYLKLHQTTLRKIIKNNFIGLGFYYDHFWKVKEIDSDKAINYEGHRFNTTEKASGIAFKYLLDNRLNQINPKNGFYADVVCRSNFKALGSTSNWGSLIIDLRKYFLLSKESNNVLAIWSFNWLTSGKDKLAPYLLLPSTGWDNQYSTGRGYIQGRYRDRNMFYLESEYRFRVTKNGLFGGVVFANVQSLEKYVNNAFSNIAPAMGFGLRIKLNKKSQANLALDYGFGQQGSQGFFVNIGEIF